MLTKQQRQEMFDKAVGGVLEQGELSVAPDSGCFYRLRRPGKKTLKCAIGHLIPDSEYHPYLENICADDPKICAIIGADPCSKYDSEFLDQLQRSHDFSNTMDRFIIDAKKMARNRKLKWNFD